jgi:hypothetical protein
MQGWAMNGNTSAPSPDVASVWQYVSTVSQRPWAEAVAGLQAVSLWIILCPRDLRSCHMLHPSCIHLSTCRPLRLPFTGPHFSQINPPPFLTCFPIPELNTAGTHPSVERSKRKGHQVEGTTGQDCLSEVEGLGSQADVFPGSSGFFSFLGKGL